MRIQAKHSIAIFAFFILGTLAAMGQTKEELQRKTQELLNEIESVKQDLEETQRTKKQALGILRGVERKINMRNQVIRNIKGEVYLVERDIIRTYREIDTMKQEIKTLKSQYAQSIVYAYKNRSNYDFLNFLFSSASFSDVLLRLSYLKTYRNFREKKAGDIVMAQKQLEEKIASLSGKRQEKADALKLESTQMTELAKEKSEKDRVVAQIQGQEKELRKTLAKKEAERKKVQNAITAAIKREREEALRREREEAAKRKAAEDAARKAAGGAATSDNTSTAKASPAPATTPVERPTREPSVLENTPESLISSQQFEGNKGRLPWPVEKAMVTLKFGDNRIPGKTRDIIQYSDGLTIETVLGGPVKAVFDGEVTSVFNIGSNQTVLLKHGKYFTTYSNLVSVKVSRGQKVSVGQVLGSAGANDFGIGEIDFRVDTERGPQNPEGWLRGR